MASNMGTYFTSLKYSVTKKEIITELTYNFDELTNTVKPMFKQASGVSLTGSVVAKTDISLTKKAKKETAFNVLMNTIESISNNEDKIIEMVKNNFNDENFKVTSDYYKLNMFKYIESIYLFNEYARKWINAAVYESISSVSKQLFEVIKNPILLMDGRYVTDNDNVAAITSAIDMLNRPLEDYLKTINSLKGHMYSEDDWNINDHGVNGQFDPFKTNFISVDWNPVYHIGLMLNTFRVGRIRRNKAELERMQFMLRGLKDNEIIEQDPEKLAMLHRTISYYNAEANKLDLKIKRMEGTE